MLASLVAGLRHRGAAGLVVVVVITQSYTLGRVADTLPASVSPAVPIVLRALGAGLFLAAGLVGVAHWRIADDARSGYSAAAWLTLGSGLTILPIVGPAMSAYPAPATRVLLTFAALAVAGRAETARATRRVPVTLAGLGLGGWLIVSLTLGIVLPSSLHPAVANSVGWRIIEAGAAIGWMWLAIRRFRRGVLADTSAGGRRWTCVALVLLAANSLSCAFPSADPAVTALLLQVCAGIVLVGVAIAVLRPSLRTWELQQGQSRSMARALAHTTDELHRAESREAERIHAARSTVAGLLGAVHLLGQPAGSALDAQLPGLFAAELRRLQHSLDDTEPDPIGCFDLELVFAPVITAHRLAGGRAGTDLDGVQVLGRPILAASVLADLLTNVRRHAPGAEVRIGRGQTARTSPSASTTTGPAFPSRTDRGCCAGANAVRARHRAAGSGCTRPTSRCALRPDRCGYSSARVAAPGCC